MGVCRILLRKVVTMELHKFSLLPSFSMIPHWCLWEDSESSLTIFSAIILISSLKLLGVWDKLFFCFHGWNGIFLVFWENHFRYYFRYFNKDLGVRELDTSVQAAAILEIIPHTRNFFLGGDIQLLPEFSLCMQKEIKGPYNQLYESLSSVLKCDLQVFSYN